MGLIHEVEEESCNTGSKGSNAATVPISNKVAAKKSKPGTPSPPLTAPPKSPERAASRSSNYSPSSNVSRSPRLKSKTSSSRSPQPSSKVVQDVPTSTGTVATATATPALSKRLSRKGLDVSPAMLEFFGMKPMTGPNACFQYIEQRQPASPRMNISGGYQETTNIAPLAKHRNGREKQQRKLWEPGPEHFTEANGYGGQGESPMCEEEEQARRDEVRRLTRKSSRELQPDEPGPEYSVHEAEAAGAQAEGGAEDREGGDAGDRDEGPFPGRGSGYAGVSESATRDAAGEVGGGSPEERWMASSAAATTARAGTAGMDSAGSGGALGAVILIKGAQIVNDDSIFVADVLIQDGIIQ